MIQRLLCITVTLVMYISETSNGEWEEGFLGTWCGLGFFPALLKC